MKGYKVYFNGEKFVSEDKLTQIPNVYLNDKVARWSESLESAEAFAAELNRISVTSVDDMTLGKDMLVRQCKECGEYFRLTTKEVCWYQYRDLNVPRRCKTCRKARKSNKLIETKMFIDFECSECGTQFFAETEKGKVKEDIERVLNEECPGCERMGSVKHIPIPDRYVV